MCYVLTCEYLLVKDKNDIKNNKYIKKIILQ